MSIFLQGLTYARNAGADLSAALYKLAHVDTDGDIVLAGDGEHAIGVIIEEAAQDKPVTVQFTGIAKVLLGGTVNPGERVASDATGLGVAAAVGDFEIGTALNGGGAGDIISVLLQSGRRHA